MSRVGWFVHHQGAGHRTRALVVGAELHARGHEVTLLGSRLGDVDERFARVDLPMDDEGVDPDGDWVTAGGRLHWVPLRHEGLRARGAAIARWVEQTCPDVVVVDVSVEVTLLVRLLGVPVVVVGQPGLRDDPPHALAFDVADAVLAPWPAGATAELAPHLRGLGDRVREVGGLSRFAAEPPSGDGSTGRAVVLGGGGDLVPGLPERIAAACPELRWELVGGRRWVDDVGPVLAGAEVVVTAAGQNAIADLAALDRPVLVLPQERAFAEQDAMAAYLTRTGLARVVGRAAQADPGTDWASEVTAARHAPTGWSRWGTTGGPQRAAELIEEVARG